jgi:hypothetical protein
MIIRLTPLLVMLLCLPAFMQSDAQVRPTRDHSGRFGQYKSLENLRDADLDAKAPHGDPIKVVVGVGLGDLDSLRDGHTTSDQLRRFGCAAEGVAVVTPQGARAAFTAEGTFVFTEYELEIGFIVKGEFDMTARGALIWPGGSLTHKGRVVTALDANFLPLELGRKYLLFLRQFSPGEFEPIRETAGYDVTGPQVKGMGVGRLREPVPSHLLVTLAQTSTSTDCRQ